MHKCLFVSVRCLLISVLAFALLPGAAVAQNRDPLSSMVAATFVDDQGTGAENAADFVKILVEQYANDELPANVQFPLSNASTDSVRSIKGFHTNNLSRQRQRGLGVV